MLLSVQQLFREMASFAISYIRYVRRSGSKFVRRCVSHLRRRMANAMELEDREWQWKLYGFELRDAY